MNHAAAEWRRRKKNGERAGNGAVVGGGALGTLLRASAFSRFRLRKEAFSACFFFFNFFQKTNIYNDDNIGKEKGYVECSVENKRNIMNFCIHYFYFI